jgi:hypothetical protein
MLLRGYGPTAPAQNSALLGLTLGLGGLQLPLPDLGDEFGVAEFAVLGGENALGFALSLRSEGWFGLLLHDDFARGLFGALRPVRLAALLVGECGRFVLKSPASRRSSLH